VYAGERTPVSVRQVYAGECTPVSVRQVYAGECTPSVDRALSTKTLSGIQNDVIFRASVQILDFSSLVYASHIVKIFAV